MLFSLLMLGIECGINWASSTLKPAIMKKLLMAENDKHHHYQFQ